MKTTAKLGLILCALTVTALADTPPATPAARSNLLPGLPTYTPPPPPPEAKAADAPADPEVLVLPKMRVKQRPRPRLNTDIVYAPKDLGNVLAKQKFTQLEQAMNKFTLPLFGQSLAERALEDHRREKKQAITDDVLNISDAIKAADPAEAKALEKAVTMP